MLGYKDTVELAIQRKKVLTVKLYSYLGSERDYIDSVLDRYLEEVGLNRLMNNISYCIHEVAGNAHKANLKRLYFMLRSLDIDDTEQYRIGMRDFKREVLQHPEKYSLPHREYGYYIKFHFQIEDPFLKVVVRNNVPLTPQEEAKINDKMKIAGDATNLADVYEATEDYSEGAGLGIVMLHVILKNLGFNNKPFQIYSRGEETIAFLSLDTRNTAVLEESYAQLMMG